MRSDSAVAPVVETSLSCYFKERLTRYAERLSPPPHDDTCWYLSSLLDRFVRSEAVFCYDAGQLTLRPLALLYSDALEATNDRQRCLLLQQLGDMALFVGAMFPERYSRRGIHQDYFVGMGGSAYDYLADNARGNRHIFAELANTFGGMLELVAQACSRNREPAPEDVLALYQRWLQTGDHATGLTLRRLGIDLASSTSLH